MSKALRSNAPLPYPHLISLFLHHFEVPLDSKPFVQIKKSFSIGAAMVASFGYRKERDGSWIKKDAQPHDVEGCSPAREDSSLLQSVMDRFDSL